MDKIPYSELEKMVNEARAQLKPDSRWRHYKGPEYRLIDVVIIEENQELAVIYSPTEHPNVSFMRPLKVWQEVVSWNGETVSRFARLG